MYMYWFIIKDITQEQPNGRDALGRVYGKGLQSFHVLGRHTTLPELHIFINLEAL